MDFIHKHTAIEWELKKNNSFYELESRTHDKAMLVNIFFNRYNKEGIVDDHHCKESEANAKLIAAAPRLLQCAEMLHTILKHNGDKNSVALHYVVDAIEKAGVIIKQ